MILGSGWTDVGMDSVEIMDFVNKHRTGRDAKLRHDSLTEKARKLFQEENLIREARTYITGNNAKRVSYKYIFTVEQTNVLLHSYLSNTKTHSKEMEYAALKAIETVLEIDLERQYSVPTEKGTFRIDGYHKETNTAYEIDEYYHLNNTIADIAREQAIKDSINCKFIRIKL